ncbi:dual oxidase maturation factor 1-like [Liolophura sinensis]|uniref:dual oxidase maturation factor 1-like n=1 Tax=Liolophura sinensis TaxID=3198878 RepID=UPI003158C652
MAYQAFRVDGGPTLYDSNKTPFKADLVESGLAFCIVILAFSFYIVLPGFPGKEKLYTFVRVSVSLFIGVVILVTNFSQDWEVAEISTETQYKAGARKGIHADIGVHIGLRGINITLKGEPEQQLNETINYNEHFSWEWGQGRIGFGPFAARINREFRAAQFRGLPYPILWIAEYFTFDGEGIRWGRFYRTAGWYSHIMLWLAFTTWLMANILFFVLLRYGAYLLMITGGCMVVANILFATIRNPNVLVIPFTTDAKLEFVYGWGFVLCLITGILAILIGFIIFVMTLCAHNAAVTFFGADPLEDLDEEIEIDDTRRDEPVPEPSRNGGAVEAERRVRSVQFDTEDDDEGPLDNAIDMSQYDDRPRYVKRRSGLLSKGFLKSRRQPRRPPPKIPEQEPELYENLGFPREEMEMMDRHHRDVEVNFQE